MTALREVPRLDQETTRTECGCGRALATSYPLFSPTTLEGRAMEGRIITEGDVSPEQWTAFRQQIERAERIAMAAGPALDRAAAYLAARGPEVSRRLTPDPRLEDTILSAPPRSVVSEAADILDQINDGLNPSDRDAADAALALAILARCQTLIDAAKARLQS